MRLLVGQYTDGNICISFAAIQDSVFDKIVFNFPHVGGATQEDVAANVQVIRGFFEQAG